jgi:GntR family transcriptional regulator
MAGTQRSRGEWRELPPSRRVAEELRQAIVEGELGPGAALPSERELARTYAIARNTARQAIAILQADGLVDAQHGRGVFVRRRRPLLRRAHDCNAPFEAEAEAQGRAARVELTAAERVPVPEWVAERLTLAPGERVLLRRERFFADEEPVQLADAYLPLTIAEGTPLADDVPAPGGVHAALERLGHSLARIDEEVTARMPLPAEIDALVLAAGVPVIDLRQTIYDAATDAIAVTHAILAGDRNALTFELRTGGHAPGAGRACR